MFLIFQIFNIHILASINYVLKKDGPNWNKIMQILYKNIIRENVSFSDFWLLGEIFERSNLREEIYICLIGSFCSFLPWSVDSVVIQPASNQNRLKYKGKPLKSLQLENKMENKKQKGWVITFQRTLPEICLFQSHNIASCPFKHFHKIRESYESVMEVIKLLGHSNRIKYYFEDWV